MEFDNIETIKQAVEIGAGISILPEPTVRKEVMAGTLVAIRLISPELWRPLGIIYRQRKVFTPTVGKFVELLRRSAGASPGRPRWVRPSCPSRSARRARPSTCSGGRVWPRRPPGPGSCSINRVAAWASAASAARSSPTAPPSPSRPNAAGFSADELQAGIRLACQSRVCRPTHVEIPPTSLPAAHPKILVRSSTAARRRPIRRFASSTSTWPCPTPATTSPIWCGWKTPSDRST